jgi:hypothetical protein
MKYIFLVLLFFSTVAVKAQKYALLDEHFTEPVKYANTVTSADKFHHLFPVEKKTLPAFIKILTQIEKKLSSNKPIERVEQYELGCVKFSGSLLSLASGQRVDYVITSTCDNVKVSMHLCNARNSNATNAFFINTWIKYIEENSK